MATKNSTEKPNNDSAVTNNAQNPAPKHDPFTVIDPRSNYPERPIVLPNTRTGANKNVEALNSTSDTSATNKTQNTAVNNTPITVLIDPRSNMPERPIIPQIVRTEQNKNVDALNHTSDYKTGLNKDGENGEKRFIDNNVSERVIIPEVITKHNKGTIEAEKDAKILPDIVSPLSNVKHDKGEGSATSIQEPMATNDHVEIKRKPPLKFEAMTPIRQV